MVFGLLLGVTGVVFAFIFARSSGAAMLGLIALGFISSSQFALASAHKLWNRVDFTSTLYRMSYHGPFRRHSRKLGNDLTSEGTLTDNAMEFLTLRVEICVAQLESVAFARDGERHITAIDLLPDACDQQFGLMENYVNGVHQRAREFYDEQVEIRNVLATGNPPPTPPGAKGADAKLGVDVAG